MLHTWLHCAVQLCHTLNAPLKRSPSVPAQVSLTSSRKLDLCIRVETSESLLFGKIDMNVRAFG